MHVVDHDFWLQIHQQTDNKSIINEEKLPISIISDLNSGNEEVCIIILSFPCYIWQ